MSLVFISGAFSQTNLNNYKYVIVPKKYDFLKEEDQFRLNGLTKFLFEKYGENYKSYIFGYEKETLQSVLVQKLKAKEKSVSFAES